MNVYQRSINEFFPIPTGSRICFGPHLIYYSLILLILPLLLSCSEPNTELAQNESPLFAGVWRGDIEFDGEPPFGAQFHVTETDS